MKFTMISKAGEGAHLLWKIKEEGNEVNLFIKEPAYRSIFKGLLPQNPLEFDKKTVYIFDSSGMGALADKLKSRGLKVFGGSSWADKLEEDRDFGIETMKKCGIAIPDYKEFSDFKSGMEYAKKSKEKLVFKPSGDDLPSKLTYVSSDSEDLVLYMEYVEKYFGDRIKSYILQEFIEGTIVSSEYWCDGTKFVGPPNQTVEVKKLMNGDKGPATGCAGNLIWTCEEDNEIIKNGIKKIEQECVASGYIGCIDLNAIVSNGNVYGLEWTPRFGLDAMPTFLQLINTSISDTLSSFVSGKGKLELATDEFAAGVRLTIPPYPLEPKNASDIQKVNPNIGIPIRGLEDRHRDNLYFYEVMLSENGNLEHSDGTGAILVASDSNRDINKCLDIPYEILDACMIPDKQYRTDLKEVLPKMYKEVMSL